MSTLTATESHSMLRRTGIRASDLVIAGLVLVVELAATAMSEPLNLVPGWGQTTSTDWLAFTIVTLGCLALVWRRDRPVPVMVVTMVMYGAFMLRDYELGMFLPPMVALYTVATLGQARLWTLAITAFGLAVSALWIRARAEGIAEDGVVTLVWVSFGVVITIFYVGSYAIGDIVRSHRMLRRRRGRTNP
ncbi:DUF7134 domain-containing protein [Natronoglycomyces albus]|uniref:DUF7134 domain-containing protein n=1 Tax=Natronoglycomyces albus TaxID=2811108 RepID=A0A895XRP4_9ACTN|nr:hypothetical protein [Natronoglycomyces albus]QSB04920.1 hypothetical protein JQS30_14310 [Natronoglycomyces albus]